MRIVLASEKENGSAFPLRYISLMSGYSVAIKHTTPGVGTVYEEATGNNNRL